MIRTDITLLAVRLLAELLEDESNDMESGLSVAQDLLDALGDLRRKIEDYLTAALDDKIDKM
jgi:hypothetical protein